MIRARNAGVRIGGRWILQDVSCAVGPGEVLGIVGPNAAGKSTLLALMTGEREATRGEVTLFDRRLAAYSPPELARRRAVVRQRSEVAFDLRVLDVVLLGRFAHEGRGDSAADLEAALGALDEVELRAVAERPYAHLSGGEQRRVQLARALAQIAGPRPLAGARAAGAAARPAAEPRAAEAADLPAAEPRATEAGRSQAAGAARFLLLDEPLANLDLHHQLDTLALLRRKAREGLGVAVVLHEIALSARACDRLLVLHEGRVDCEGAPDQVLTPELFARVFRVEAEVRRDPRAGLAIDLVRTVSGPQAPP